MFTKKLSTCLEAICMSECAHPRLQGGGTKVRSQNNLSSFFDRIAKRGTKCVFAAVCCKSAQSRWRGGGKKCTSEIMFCAFHLRL